MHHDFAADAPAAPRQKPKQRQHQRALAGSAGAGKAQKLAAAQLEAQIAKDGFVAIAGCEGHAQ